MAKEIKSYICKGGCGYIGYEDFTICPGCGYNEETREKPNTVWTLKPEDKYKVGIMKVPQEVEGMDENINIIHWISMGNDPSTTWCDKRNIDRKFITSEEGEVTCVKCKKRMDEEGIIQ